MPAKNYLKKEQKQKLQEGLKQEENKEIRERILILLLLNDGKTQKEIAEFRINTIKMLNLNTFIIKICVFKDLDSNLLDIL